MPKLTPNSFDDPAWAIVTRGSEAYASSRFADAIACYTTALNSFNERTPTAAIMETYICRGAAFGRAGNEQAAIDDFTKAIELNPQSAMAFYDRGISRQTLGQFDLAIDDFSRVIELRPKYVSGFIRRGVCRKRLNDVQGARSDFAEAKRLIAAEKPTDQRKMAKAKDGKPA
jgi:tetratricopeptide (TPR) repeat protein